MSLTRLQITGTDVAAGHELLAQTRQHTASDNEIFLREAATHAVQRWLTHVFADSDAHSEIAAHTPPDSAPELSDPATVIEITNAHGDVSRILVVAEPSSMQPARDWPIHIRCDLVESLGIDAVIGAYVPKRAALDSFGQSIRPSGYLVGWISLADLASHQRVNVVEHVGQPHNAMMWIVQVGSLNSMTALVMKCV